MFPGRVLQISSDGGDWRISSGLKFSIRQEILASIFGVEGFK